MSKLIVLFVEGETEIEFYKKLVTQLRMYCSRFEAQIIYKNLNGIGNYKIRAKRIFEKDIKANYSNTEIIIALCYDTDVFEFSQKPPINWSDVEKDLKNIGAKKIIHIKAKKSIEDWFLEDEVNVKKFLRLAQSVNSSKTGGLKKLQELFKKAGKVYVKGAKVEGFIIRLNMQKIMKAICKELKPLCTQLGIRCDGDKCHS